MPLALLTFITGLAISAVAIYYSVIGLAAIFAAAVVPIMVMGAILEVGKLVAAWWLKWNWHRAPFLLKSYMLLAVIVLMLITSMGIFGFLSKAHTEQAVPVGDNLARIEIIDERIAIQQEVIVQARQDIAILDQQIERFTELGAVTRGVNVRNQQREEREALTNQISLAQDAISELRLERAPFAASLRAIEAEVGPIKYIAKLIYGDNPDQNLLEKAVVWVIIVIVFVFDPLAVLLLLASQLSFQWARQDKLAQQALIAEVPKEEPEPEPVKEESQESKVEEPLEESVEETEPAAEPVEEVKEEPVAEDAEKNVQVTEIPAPSVNEEVTPEESVPVKEIEEPTSVKKLKPAVINLSNKEFLADDFDLTNVRFPDKPFRGQQIQLDPEDDDSYYIFNGTDWVHSPVSHAADAGYRQNSEQNESTIWSKIQDKKNG